MALWWVGNVLLLVAVVPILVALLNRVLAALERIRWASDDILAGGVALTAALDDVPELLAGACLNAADRAFLATLAARRNG